MRIACNIKDIKGGNANCEVEIKSNHYDNAFLTDFYEAMQYASILRGMRDHNKKAFNAAMEHFIEEELSNE